MEPITGAIVSRSAARTPPADRYNLHRQPKDLQRRRRHCLRIKRYRAGSRHSL